MKLIATVLSPRLRNGFTLVELLISIAILSLLMALISELFDTTTGLITRETRHMDADAQARGLLDRMSLDFGRMLQRPDVSYYLKSSSLPQTGNDQLAFYSEVAGYYPATESPSPLSLVSYRLNPAKQQLERLGKGLAWNADASTNSSLFFLNASKSNIESTWPAATSPTAPDVHYESIGPQVFRFEYYYILAGHELDLDGAKQWLPSIPSNTPWDTRAPLEHTEVDGLKDVVSIAVVIAVLDANSRKTHADLQPQIMALTSQMNDFAITMAPGGLESQWQAAVDSSTLPRMAKSAVRIYSRHFNLNPNSSPH
jgi:prepilin-type N-terminal cleavage/methylation domain-containing protein